MNAMGVNVQSGPPIGAWGPDWYSECWLGDRAPWQVAVSKIIRTLLPEIPFDCLN